AAIDCFNEHDDPDLSKGVLGLCNLFTFKSVKLTKDLEEDFKIIEEIISRERFAARKHPGSTQQPSRGFQKWFSELKWWPKTDEATGYLVLVVSLSFIVLGLYCLSFFLADESAFEDKPEKKPEVPGQSILRNYTPPTTNRGQSNQAEPEIEPWRLAMPATGIMQRYGNLTDAVAPLTIRTRKGSGNYYVKISRVDGDRLILSRTAFIRDGGTLETTMPLGDYEIRYAIGENWYGPKRRFGKRTSYAKADTVFSFQETSRGYSGFTVELYRQLNGNLETDPLTADEF
ncbi:hypothetical protein OAK98_04380, partial [Mariniblastus sp.]|nr:hypothetical protein [Mariniblastus sp.]